MSVPTLEDDYNVAGVASLYKMSKTLPFRKYVEEYTFFKTLGDLKGLKILDLACGEGHYTRQLKARGAAEVVGVDISSSMIRLANQQEKATPIGCRYVCADAANIEAMDQFDIVTGVYYLCVADSVQMLEDLGNAALKNLKPGGKFVGILQLDLASSPDSLSKYGIHHEGKKDLKDGDCIGISFRNPDKSICQIHGYYWSEYTYELSLLKAGFDSVQWRGPYLDPVLPKEYPSSYWQDLIDVRGVVAVEARKISYSILGEF